MKSKLTLIRFALLTFFFYHFMGAFTPYFVAMGLDRGFSQTFVSIAISFQMVCVLLGNTLWGRISDHYGSSKKVFIASMFCATLFQTFLFASPNAVVYFLMYGIFGTCSGAMGVLLDTWFLDSIGYDMSTFRKIRSFGSLGYGSAILISGMLLKWQGYTALFILSTFMLILTALLCIGVAEVRRDGRVPSHSGTHLEEIRRDCRTRSLSVAHPEEVRREGSIPSYSSKGLKDRAAIKNSSGEHRFVYKHHLASMFHFAGIHHFPGIHHYAGIHHFTGLHRLARMNGKQRNTGLQFFHDHKYLIWVMLILLSGLATAPVANLKVVLLERAGAGPQALGVDGFLGSMVQFVMFFAVSRLDHLRPARRMLIVSGCVVSAITLYLTASGIVMIYMGSMLLYGTYSIINPCTREIVRDSVIPREQTTAMGIADACQNNVSTMISMLYSGMISERFGMNTLLSVCLSMALFTGIMCVVLSTGRKHPVPAQY